MQKLLFAGAVDQPLTVLCLGAHSDDVEIGCGGTILSLLSQPRSATVHWVVFSGDEQRSGEAKKSASLFLECAKDRSIDLKNYRESFFPAFYADLKEEIRAIKTRVSPDVIFVHRREDLHQDHRALTELALSEFRDHLILEYEIPKYDGDLGSPNVYVPLEEAVCCKKVDYLHESFGSQQFRTWFKRETFYALMRLRGVESNSPSGLAEAFFCRKLVFQC